MSIPYSRSLISSRQIFHFLAIVDHGSLSRASKAVNITEPALSKSIRMLENYLQVPLFDRTAYGLVLTVYGKTLLHHARVIAVELRHATEELADLSGAHAGHVYMGAGPTFVQSVLPHAVGALRAEHPNLKVFIEEGYLDTLVPRVLQGELDFAMLVIEAAGADPELSREPLYTDEVVFVARAEHALAQRRPVSLADLAEADWAMPPREDKLSMALANIFHEAELAPPRAFVETSSINFTRQLIALQDYITFAPKHLFARELESGAFVDFTDSVPPIRRTVGVVYRKNWSRSPAAAALLAKLRATIIQLGLKL
jgi:DNA-binding transcriptional LysR family regulator